MDAVSSLSAQLDLVLACSFNTMDERSSEYKKLQCQEREAGQIYLLMLNELQNAVTNGDANRFKKVCLLIESVKDVEHHETLKTYFISDNNPLKKTNLVILACRYKRENILQTIFNDCNVYNIFVGIGQNALLPHDEDENCHTALYYAIRSGNIQILNVLIRHWPGNYFDENKEKLDVVLSCAYEELRLKNVPLTEEMEIYVENELINLRFFSDVSQEAENILSCDSAKSRISILLRSIELLNSAYSAETNEVKESFLFIAKFIASNMHVLKQQLKSTYDTLPWEEMEFCLISFISCKIKREKINLFYNATLSKRKILNYLTIFAKILKEISEDIGKFWNRELPKEHRDQVVLTIVKNFPEFEGLYNDYNKIRDVHSLRKVSEYAKLALQANANEREGQLTILRAIQIISEHLKNTLESPKLSAFTSEHLLISLPVETMQIFLELRNSSSPKYSLYKRTEIDQNADVAFFRNIQNDIKVMDEVAAETISIATINTIRFISMEIAKSKTTNELKEAMELLNNIEVDGLESFNKVEVDGLGGNYEAIDQRLKKHLKKLKEAIPNQSERERKMFNAIEEIINVAKRASAKNEMEFPYIFKNMKSFISAFHDGMTDCEDVRSSAIKQLVTVDIKMKESSLEKILGLTKSLCHVARQRLKGLCNHDIDRIYFLIKRTVKMEIDRVEYVDEIRRKIDRSGFISENICISQQSTNVTSERCDEELDQKISELRIILKDNALSHNAIDNVPSYKRNRKLQASVEMLVLDILSILNQSERILVNSVCLDDSAHVLTGECLWRKLEHDDALFDVFSSNVSTSIYLNAEKLVSESLHDNKSKVGKFKRDDAFECNVKFKKSLDAINNQENMFVALTKGNFSELLDCIKLGADINARDIYQRTSFHYAASGSCLEILKYIQDQKLKGNATNVNGQTPLHIAAEFGKEVVIEFLLSKCGVFVDEADKNSKSPLHIAAKIGNTKAVETLLRFKANALKTDKNCYNPLLLASKNGHFEIVKLLLQTNVDVNDVVVGMSALHSAADMGHLEIVTCLLEKGAKIHFNSDRVDGPLHSAARNGHLEVVDVLLRFGGNVNAPAMDGTTPLHAAAKAGQDKIVQLLLQHGAKIDVIDKENHRTPLYDAANEGHERVVETLLSHKADASCADNVGLTPFLIAAHDGRLNIMKTLIKYGADIYAIDINKATALHHASLQGDVEIAEFLIKNGLSVDCVTSDKRTPLHLAARKGFKDMVALLLRENANVKAVDKVGLTPLHYATGNGNTDVIELLIKHKSDIEARSDKGDTPLNVAIAWNKVDSVSCLMKYKANVNSKNYMGVTPLLSAVIAGYKDIVTVLLKNKAKVNAYAIAPDGRRTALMAAVDFGYEEIVSILLEDGASVQTKLEDGVTPLLWAVRNNQTTTVKALLKYGANIREHNYELMACAINGGYKEIFDILIQQKPRVNVKDSRGVSLLHYAAERGNVHMVSTLIAKGAEINDETKEKITPLHFAAQRGHVEVAKILIKNGADINSMDKDSAPIHLAATFGNHGVLEVLLQNGADINIENVEHQTAIELAVFRGHIQVVKVILQHRRIDLNARHKDLTLLLLASGQKSLAMVKFLVNRGCDMQVPDMLGSKPIHTAAREGSLEIVKFYLSRGFSVNEKSGVDLSPLHNAALGNHLELVKFLIEEGAEINAIDMNGLSPLHMGVFNAGRDVIKLLLDHGAIFNAVDATGKIPVQDAKDKDVVRLLKLTENFFDSVKRNSVTDVEKYIKQDAAVNAKNSTGATALHYAAWKGYEEVVATLLNNKANPNLLGTKGFTPLHYAVQSSHCKIVHNLLCFCAMYDACSDTGKTPLDYCKNAEIRHLLTLISSTFGKVRDGHVDVLKDLSTLRDIDILKSVMNACNKDREILIFVAMRCEFPMVDQLKLIWRRGSPPDIDKSFSLASQGNPKEALAVLKAAVKRMEGALGAENPGTLDLQTNISRLLHQLGKHEESLNLTVAIFQKQKKLFGLNHSDTLRTRHFHGLLLYSLSRSEDALHILEDVNMRRKEKLGILHAETLETQFYMSIALLCLLRLDEAMALGRYVYHRRKDTLGPNHASTLEAENHIGLILKTQGKYDEAFYTLNEVLEKRRATLGIGHKATLETQSFISETFYYRNRKDEALRVLREVEAIQKKVHPPNHPRLLDTQYKIGNILYGQGRWNDSCKIFNECLKQRTATFGPSDSIVADITEKLRAIRIALNSPAEHLKCIQKDFNAAVAKGDSLAIRRLLEDGADANHKDDEGRTPLHFAIHAGHKSIVKYLLTINANVAHVTNKGNTTLHTATSKGYGDIVESLLKHVAQADRKKFINVKTATGGTTALHVAAKSGSLMIVRTLLGHGAIYDVLNNEGKRPVDLTADARVRDLLKLIEELFVAAKDSEIVEKLENVSADDVLAISNCCNQRMKTILEVAPHDLREDIEEALLNAI